MSTAQEHMRWVIRRALLRAEDNWRDVELRRRYLLQARNAYKALRGLQ